MEGFYRPPRRKKWTKYLKRSLIIIDKIIKSTLDLALTIGKCHLVAALTMLSEFALLLIFLLVLLLVLFLLIFVVFPIVFMNSIELQRLLIFTHMNLPSTKAFFEKVRFAGYKNRYIIVKDLNGSSNLTLGLWHILPTKLAFQAMHQPNFDFDEALENSDFSVLLYFHGTGECRADSLRKYEKFRQSFHVIVFDYRSYADSSSAILSEEAVVNDSIQLYRWLKNRTASDIYVWGHSLGSALAVSTVVKLKEEGISPVGLVLESAFTSMSEEIYVHPYGKIFAWLPWFKATVVDPLYSNGFRFETAKHISNLTIPLMIIHAEDDDIVPFKFGKALYQIAKQRNESSTIFYDCPEDLKANHIYIHNDPLFYYFILDFLKVIQVPNEIKRNEL